VDLLDLGLDRPEAAHLLFLTPEPGIELAVEPSELRDLSGGALYCLPLLLQQSALLRNLFGELLKHRETVLQVRNRDHRLIDRLQGAFDTLNPALDVLEAARGGLIVLIERFEARRGVAVGTKGVVGLTAHPTDVFGQLTKLATKALGLLVEARDQILVAEELLELTMKFEGCVGFLSEGAHLLAEALDALGPLFGCGHTASQLLHGGQLLFGSNATFPEGFDLCGAVEQGRQGPQLLSRGLGAHDQRVKAGGSSGAIGVFDSDRRVAVVAATASQERHHEGSRLIRA
jgi:hypothetical protein